MLATSIDALVLRALDAADAEELFRLVEGSAEHLTANGDYADLVSASLETIRLELADETNNHLRFGMSVAGRLVGRLDLVPVDPPRYGLGYWLAETATGRGYATAAVRAAADHARIRLRATDIFAGVTHGNAKSVAVLERAGFRPIADFECYTRFHRELIAGARE